MDDVVYKLYNTAIAAQSNVVEFCGCQSKQPDSSLWPYYEQGLQHSRYRLDRNQTLHLADGRCSYIFNQLDNNVVIIDHPSIHVLVRKSRNSYIILRNKVIAGVDIISCNGVTVACHNYDWIGVETSVGVDVVGQLNYRSRMMVYNSLDVTLVHGEERYPLPANPFNRLDITLQQIEVTNINQSINMKHSLSIVR